MSESNGLDFKARITINCKENKITVMHEAKLSPLINDNGVKLLKATLENDEYTGELQENYGMSNLESGDNVCVLIINLLLDRKQKIPR